ncbi:unnamed protein product [Cunninghamella blakesleeana]
MRLRVRHPQGLLTIDSFTPENTVQELCQNIESLIQISEDKWVQLSNGYPLKTITDRSLSLQDAGIKNGDALTVTFIEAPKPSNHSDNADIVSVPISGGFLVQRVMDDDNSCLFRSIGYVLERDHSTTTNKLRQVIAKTIEEDPDTYSDVTLGQTREKYIEWILKENSWGGAIELAIFSKHYDIEIASIDVQSGRIDRFGEGSFNERVFVLYSGIHYDALAFAPMENSPIEFDQTRFPVADELILKAAQNLASVLRRDHKYTDTTNFTLKCEICQAGLIGEKDAHAHAASTGHTSFAEYV